MSTKTKRAVLHVDDDPQLLRVVARRLQSAGYDVHSVNDAETVLGLLLETDCRVVVLDIDMPGVNGLDLLRRIKQQDGGVQVIMLTGVVTMSTVLQSMRWGAEACVFKPLADADALLEALDASFTKIDRWWRSLQELNRRKREDENITVASATT